MQEEIVQTIERLNGQFEDLVVRGVRSSGSEHLTVLEAMRTEFERIGAGHLASRVADLVSAIQRDDRGAAQALLRAQTSLRLFERLLTLEVAQNTLQAFLAGDAPGEFGEEADGTDADEDTDGEDA